MSIQTKWGQSAIAMVAAVPLLAGAATAQETEVDTSDTIIVTAQKREQDVQDVGISIVTFGDEDLDRLRILDAASLTEFVPNMELIDTGDSAIPIFVIRGVGLQDYNTNNTPTTALVVDDVYQPYGVYGAFTLFDTERVEILRGPQGGLYGRNSTGGAINLVSRTPSFDRVEANGAVDVGNYGTVNARGGVSVPLADTLAFRVAGQYERSDGWFYNTLLDRDQGGKDKLQFRGTLAFEPTDSFRITVRHTYGRDKSEVSIPELEGYLDPNTSWEGPLTLFGSPDMNVPINPDGSRAFCDAVLTTGIPDATCITMNRKTPDGPYRGEDAVVRQFDDSFNSTSLNIDWDLGPVTLVSISNYSSMNFHRPNGSGSRGLGAGQDEAAWILYSQAVGRIHDGNLDDAYITNYDNDIESWSQELRFLGESGDRFTWMVGGVYASDELVDARTCSFNSNLYFDFAVFPGCGRMTYEQTTRAASAYVQLSYALNDVLRLTGDARYTYEKKEYRNGNVLINDGAWTCLLFGLDPADPGPFGCAALVGYDPVSGTFPLVIGAEADYEQNQPSWKVNLDWTPTDNLLLYVSGGRTFKSGGFFGGFFFAPSEIAAYDPEINTAVEAGFKSDFADGAVRLNGAVFRYDYKDFQGNLSTPDPVSGAIFSGLTNLGDVEIWGAEVELQWLPVEGLDLRLGAGWLDTEITRVADGGLSGIESGTTNILGEIIDTKGNELNNAPEFSINALARYDFQVSATIGAALQANVNWTSDYFLSVSNEPYSKEEGRALFNLRAELYQAAERGWKIALWVRNLSDEHYRLSTYEDGIFSNYSVWSAPRTWGATLSYDY